MSAPLTIDAPRVQAVWLTVPPCVVHVSDLRAWVAKRCELSESTFAKALQLLCRAGKVRRVRTGMYQLSERDHGRE